jgi:formylglycine-generating enzyme required for sulfatase activity
MVRVRGGTFDMGDVMGDGEEDDETVHRVRVADFYIGRTEVTFEEYDRFCEATGRDKPGDAGWGRGKRPVINVSWYDAIEYCNWLSVQHSLTPYYAIDKTRKDPNNTSGLDDLKWMVTPNRRANGYRLPTEAEWEYAAREGGRKVRFGHGKDLIDPREINFDASAAYKKPYSVVGEYRGRTVPVGSLNSPNALGLHDMSGNVWEWCWDWYGSYSGGAEDNPQGAGKGSDRVSRGGSWDFHPQYCRAAYRFRWRPTLRFDHVGFRLARS